VEVDLLHGLDLAGLDETTELGDGLPLLLLVLGSTATTAATTTTTATVTTTVSSTRCESATSCSTVSHCVDMCWLLLLSTKRKSSASCRREILSHRQPRPVRFG
jgi:hypothetical protein